MSRMKVALFGVTGRMGSEIVRAIHERPEVMISMGFCAHSDRAQSRGYSFPVVSEWSEKLDRPDVLIDFSSPEGALIALEVAFQQRIPILIGTTGLPERYEPVFEKVGTVVPVVRASNTSVGVTVLADLVRRAVTQLGPEFQIEVSEIHHSKKKDAPSGTALTLARAAAAARDQELQKVRRDGRSGEGLRPADEIGMHALRGGDVVGEHTVYLFGQGERIELTHRVHSRAVFAHGALRAARWLVKAAENGQKGVFGMPDVVLGSAAEIGSRSAET